MEKRAGFRLVILKNYKFLNALFNEATYLWKDMSTSQKPSFLRHLFLLGLLTYVSFSVYNRLTSFEDTASISISIDGDDKSEIKIFENEHDLEEKVFSESTSQHIYKSSIGISSHLGKQHTHLRCIYLEEVTPPPEIS